MTRTSARAIIAVVGRGIKWEGDTLVLDSISFVDSTWLGRGGLFHSGDMRISEKLTRQGNEILYEVTAQDPESFLEPWVMAPANAASEHRERRRG